MEHVARKLICLRHPASNCPVERIAKQAGWQVCAFHDLAGARALVKGNDVCVGVVLLSGVEPEDWLRQVEDLFLILRGVEWVAVVDGELLDQPAVRDCVAAHFLDFHTLPVDPERFLYSLGHAYGMASLLPASRTATRHDCIIGDSEQTRKLIAVLDKVARVDAPLLVTGESGTGKELAASAIHMGSARSDGQLVVVNCAELPPNLIHAELFGYEKGAFTGAHRRKIGYLEQADGGTIFLDEIGDLPIELQVLLLRFMQESTIRRVGGTCDIRVEARIIAATHVDLPAAVREGRFREDLYHRLNVLRVRVPSLRERSGDIEFLARHFFSSYVSEVNKKVRGFSPGAVRAMLAYHWPGNIRELMNRVRRALVMCDGRSITAADLGIEGKVECLKEVNIPTLEYLRAEAERSGLRAALCQARGDANRAAEMLAVSRATFYRLMEKHEIRAAGL